MTEPARNENVRSRHRRVLDKTFPACSGAGSGDADTNFPGTDASFPVGLPRRTPRRRRTVNRSTSSPVIRGLLVSDSGTLAEHLAPAIDGEPGMELAGSVTEAADSVQTLRNARPDVVLVDIGIGRDALRALLTVRNDVSPVPRVLGVGFSADEGEVWGAMDAGADYCVMWPFDVPTLFRRMRQIVRQPLREDGAISVGGRLETAVEKVLASLGVPASLKGYGYLVEAITATVRWPELINHVTGRLYPLVAARRQSTPRRVERAIRTCIEATWSRGNLPALERLFAFQVDPQRGKPTNAAFIAQVATEVRLRRGLRPSRFA